MEVNFEQLEHAALADDWKEYENPNYSFTIHFPVEPTVATYQAAYGRLISCAAIGIAQLGRLDRAFAGPLLGPEAALSAVTLIRQIDHFGRQLPSCAASDCWRRWEFFG